MNPSDLTHPLSPDFLEAAGVHLFGVVGWRDKLALALGTVRHTVDNWVSGRAAMPAPAVRALRYLVALKALENAAQLESLPGLRRFIAETLAAA